MLIETANGRYEIKKPGGPVGVKNLMMLGKLAMLDGIKKVPEQGTEDPELIKQIVADNEKLVMQAAFDMFPEWASTILPTCIVSGPYKYEDMPGEDQLAIFLATIQEMNVGDELFRVVPPVSS